jgi:hypothetical protein
VPDPSSREREILKRKRDRIMAAAGAVSGLIMAVNAVTFARRAPDFAGRQMAEIDGGGTLLLAAFIALCGAGIGLAFARDKKIGLVWSVLYTAVPWMCCGSCLAAQADRGTEWVIWALIPLGQVAVIATARWVLDRFHPLE